MQDKISNLIKVKITYKIKRVYQYIILQLKLSFTEIHKICALLTRYIKFEYRYKSKRLIKHCTS